MGAETLVDVEVDGSRGVKPVELAPTCPLVSRGSIEVTTGSGPFGTSDVGVDGSPLQKLINCAN